MKFRRLRSGYTRRLVALSMMVLAVIATGLMNCTSGDSVLPDEGEMTLSLSSPMFQDGENIPIRYTCEGDDVSPPLAWDEPAAGTQSLVLIVDDPDAPGGVFTHWLLFNLPADSQQLPEAVPAQNELPNGALQGTNDFAKIGYGGPCPASGATHHYRFTIYALDRPLDLKAGVSRKQVIDAIKGHILARGQLTAIYQR
jgi:Raf kinase inhibitor-like YbhB/YbcL family protein